MLTRPPFDALAQRQPQSRSLSHGLTVETLQQEPRLGLSHLSHVRSVSGPQPSSILPDRQYASQPVTAVEFDLEFNDSRPEKRARLDVDLDLVASPQAYTQDEDIIHRTIPGQTLSMPVKMQAIEKRRSLRQNLAEQAARKADGLTPPVIATRIPSPKSVADFEPWHGQHPEDILNEHVIKSGYSEKSPSPNQNESSSAKLSIWPVLSQKNNVPLQTLSLFFTQVLEKRQHLGKCTAPSSFKPPPRVTVTDTKREAWLRDLANSSIPLRRQSRTIPHGIRGKLLLDQCVSKAVPLQRAVWLAKCVGANELRAFRRKGVAGSVAAQGEAKWIRDWTISVEQFLDESMRANNQPDWRQRIEYAVKVVTALYSEGLLEREHFLDWIVASLGTSELDRVPCWLLLTQICWDDIVSYGRRGRALAKALLSHLSVVKQNAFTIHSSLRSHLHTQLQVMLKKAQHCLVIPSVWQKYQDMVQELAAPAVIDHLTRRNERLMEPTGESQKAHYHPTVRLYDLLDKIGLKVDVSALTMECTSIMRSTTELVKALITWASSRYRHGKHRAVLAERIITTLHEQGHDTDAAILSFLAISTSADIDAVDVFAIITGLARAESFSYGRYMKWLITSGAMSRSDVPSIATRLLLVLPHQQLPQHLQNTRVSLLARLPDDGPVAAVNSQSQVEALLNDGTSSFRLQQTIDAMAPTDLPILYHFLEGQTASLKDASVSLHTFTVLRGFLEACRDTQGLASLLQASLSSEDFTVLASISDTINMHAEELAVISKLAPLTYEVQERYRLLRTQQPLERTSNLALTKLFSRLDDRVAMIKLLKKDLLIHDRQHLSAVCSPASDNLISMQAGSIETDDEIEAVFASGNTMDEQLMRRVFTRILQRLEKPPSDAVSHTPACRWFVHLRSLDQTAFDKIVAGYITQTLTAGINTFSPGVYALAASECIGIDKIVASLEDTMPSTSIMAVLRLLAAPLQLQHALDITEQYHLDVLRLQHCRDHADTLLKLSGRAISTLDSSAESSWLASLCVRLARLSDIVAENGYAHSVCKYILHSIDSSTFGDNITPADAITNANALNVRLCCACLGADVSSVATREAITSSIMVDSPIWPAMLQGCSREIVKEIHSWSLEHLLNDDSIIKAQQHLSVLDLTHILLARPVDQGLLGSIANKLKTLPRLLSGSDVSVILTRVETLLHVTVLCGQTTTDGDSFRQGRALIALALCSVLSTPAVEGNPQLAEYVTDVANMFIDRLPGEVVKRLEKSAQNNNLSKKSIAACFGGTVHSDGWLSLASAQQGAPPARMLLKPGQASTLTSTGARPQQPQAARFRTQQPNVDLKYTAYATRPWEVMSDPTPVIGENDASISLALFGARKV